MVPSCFGAVSYSGWGSLGSGQDSDSGVKGGLLVRTGHRRGKTSGSRTQLCRCSGILNLQRPLLFQPSLWQTGFSR